jgi:hypothetical protein
MKGDPLVITNPRTKAVMTNAEYAIEGVVVNVNDPPPDWDTIETEELEDVETEKSPETAVVAPTASATEMRHTMDFRARCGLSVVHASEEKVVGVP